ncbi:AbiJ-NTD4 domain-containing protein [Microbacterium maritypicum]|uniref:AbiJ-NTD4 domain-containing protein n=1 Tax=Microbacterium maritypicum TaxID=33918 RepID=UPI003827658E
MATFSERHGYKEVRTLIQRESLDDDTRLELWNLLAVLPREFDKFYQDPTEHGILEALWIWYFKKARDEMPYDSMVWKLVKEAILTRDWNEVLDLVEQFMKHWDRLETDRSAKLKKVFLQALNQRFEQELVGYRMIGLEITPVDSTAEADAVSGALSDTDALAGARHALDRAVELLADRATPDYPNSIKESISAVEAVVKKVTGEGTLGKGLTKLEGAGLTIHPALKGAWSQMYGWTSNDDGIRHGGIEAADADQALAKYVLVTCSAFVSYLIEEGRKASLLT